VVGLSARGDTSVRKETLREVYCEFFGPPGCALSCVSCGEDDALALGLCAVCVCCSSWWENAHHPTAQLAAFMCPDRIKAFRLLCLVKLCRFSSHMHTLASLA